MEEQRAPHLLKQAVIDKLAPGVKELVVWLNAQGFPTCDSGDGSNFKNDMACGVPFPMVAINSDPRTLIADAGALYDALRARGVPFDLEARGYTCDPPEEANWPQIEATYDPADGHAIIMLINVLSKDAKL